MKKILVSYGFGAGWSTWSSKPKEVAEYAPIIEFIENGGNTNELNPTHPLIVQMKKDLELDYFYCGGSDNLSVEKVSGPYRINEYGGAESVQTSIDFW